MNAVFFNNSKLYTNFLFSKNISLIPRVLKQRGNSYFSTLPSFATVDVYNLNPTLPGTLKNCVDGQWVSSKNTHYVVNPLNGEKCLSVPNTHENELNDFITSMSQVPRSGKHNIYKHPERFLLYGEVYRKIAEALHNKDIFNYFVTCIQYVMPKAASSAASEIQAVRRFFENYSGDNIRRLMRGFIQAGDYHGQRTIGYRWPYGAVAVISPFNFPLKIPVIQFASAAMVGNKPLVKPEHRVGLPVEQFLRLMHQCGLPKNDIDLIHCSGTTMETLLRKIEFPLVQFTGGTSTAKKIMDVINCRIKIEDAGFDWKILGPMPCPQSLQAKNQLLDYVSWQCDVDAYSMSGQQCSAQSILFIHSDWINENFMEKLKKLSQRRTLSNLSLSPIMSHTNESIQKHINELLKMPKTKILFGGKPLTNHSVPPEFGAFEPTAILVDLKEALASKEIYSLVTTEIFAPIQIVIEWSSMDEPLVLRFLDNMKNLLTAAVVSNDPLFMNRILGSSSNGTTYCGIQSRTTGAPPNHWFGPAGTPLAAGIATPEAVLSTWTCHREIIYEEGPISKSWIPPE